MNRMRNHPARLALAAAMAIALPDAVAPLRSHDTQSGCPPVLIDTDMGLDDLVAVGMALQSPHRWCG